MKFDIVTIFPAILDSYLKESIIKRAIAKKIIRVKTWDLRDFSVLRHAKVDDRPYGGGPGMVIQIAPVHKAVKKIISRAKNKNKTRVILFSARGKKLDGKMVSRLAKYDQIIMICGRYEGVDERVAKYVADETISIGDYILAGGELPAMVLIEAVSRRIPGVLGKLESLETIKGSYPTYTRPEIFIPKKGEKWPVPKVLLEGSHIKIKKWREKKDLQR